jgi:Glu-tRNA(Gln) amidotransferase subunit E-like FAD-binding protein
MLTMDLYNEILKSQEVSKTIEEFTNELAENPTVRDNFLTEFVDEVIDSMDPKDIIRAYAHTLLEDLYKQCDNNQEDYIVQECAECFPYVLERFGVITE